MVEVCYKKDGLQTCSEISDKFNVNIDWELDYFGGECHGSELFTERDTVEIEFTQLKNGDLFVEFGPQKTLFLQSKGVTNRYCWKGRDNLLECHVSSLIPGGYDVDWIDQGGAAAYTANQKLADCYRKSILLNAGLTPAQRAIVTTFFEKAALTAVATR